MSDPSFPSSADIEDLDRAHFLLKRLLDIGAISIRPHDPFTWTSGLAAPIYCDLRRSMADPTVRRSIAAGFEHVIRHQNLLPVTIAGTATAGIPHAAWLADRVEAPMAYIRGEEKGHGQGRRIEGARLGADDEVVVVEDLISTGGSALDAVAAVRQTGASVRAVFSIFTYELAEAEAAFAEGEVPHHVLTSFGVLLDVAHERGALSDEALAVLREWRADPEGWSGEHGGEDVWV